MDKNKQKMRFNEIELGLIKATFVDNWELLKALRKTILRFPMTTAEMQLITNLQDKKEVLAVIRKAFLPTLDGDAPVHQMIDLWMTVSINEKSPREAYPHIRARKLLIEFIEQQLCVLEGKPTKSKLSLDKLITVKGNTTDNEEDIYVNLLVRNTMISHTDMQLAQFEILAGQNDETLQQTLSRLQKNSAK